MTLACGGMCAFFLAVWLFNCTNHLHPFADHGAQGGTLVIAIAVISFKTICVVSESFPLKLNML